MSGSDRTPQHAGLAVRASDAEREQEVALLQRSFADGRLTQAELEERAGAAYGARDQGPATRSHLRFTGPGFTVRRAFPVRGSQRPLAKQRGPGVVQWPGAWR
jgi:Domain of unknown function (DUF1707)